MAEMSPRERVLTAMRLGVPDRVPRNVSFENGLLPTIRKGLARDHPGLDLKNLDLEEHFLCDPRWVGLNPTQERLDYSRYYDDPRIVWEEWGYGRRWDETNHYAEYIYPLKDAETAAKFTAYPWPDLLEDYRYEGMADRVAAIKAKGFEVLGGPSARLMEDMLLNLELAHACFQPILERNVLYAREINPDMLVWSHSDGDITDLVPDLIRVGLNILNPVQPEACDAAFLKKTYDDRLAFWGGLGVQSVLPFGTPGDVREHVRTMIATLGKNGGYLVAPSHILERDTPYENVKAMMEAIDEFGVHD